MPEFESTVDAPEVAEATAVTVAVAAPPSPRVESPPPLPVAQRVGPDAVDADEPRVALHRLAEQLMRHGNRTVLAEYLRLRRAVRLA